MPKQRKPTLFLDRDGTLIEEKDYLKDPSQVKLLPGVVAGLKTLKKAGYALAVVSNQSGVGRGMLTRVDVERVNRHFISLLKSRGVTVKKVYWCPHLPSDRCSCRKPAPGLLKKAARDLGTAWRGGISVGDRQSDIDLAQSAGGKGILVLTGYGRENWKAGRVKHPDYVAKNFTDVVRWILKEGTSYE